MKLSCDGQLVRGACIDEETKGVLSEPAKIEGTFENGSILFYKTYPQHKVAEIWREADRVCASV